MDKIGLRIDPETADQFAELWFELVICDSGWGYFYIGVDSGSRPVTPALRIKISNAFDPPADIVSLAEHAYKDELPFTLVIDSEGPMTRLTLRPGTAADLAIFEVHDMYRPVILFAAEVNLKQFAIALAHAIQVAIRNPDYNDAWHIWNRCDYVPTPGKEAAPFDSDYFGNAWLRDLVIDPHPHQDMYYEGIDTYNYTEFHRNE